MQRAPGFPCALCFSRDKILHNSGASRRGKVGVYLAEQQLLAVLRRKHDVVLALPGRVIKMIELCFHHGLLEGSWRFPKETS